MKTLVTIPKFGGGEIAIDLRSIQSVESNAAGVTSIKRYADDPPILSSLSVTRILNRITRAGEKMEQAMVRARGAMGGDAESVAADAGRLGYGKHGEKQHKSAHYDIGFGDNIGLDDEAGEDKSDFAGPNQALAAQSETHDPRGSTCRPGLPTDE